MEDFNYISNKLFAELQQELREQLSLFLYGLQPLIKADVILALEEPGKLFAQSNVGAASFEGGWSLLSLLVAQQVDGTVDRRCATRVAIAVECLICALDILDDIEDGDQTTIILRLGIPRVLNISTTLLMLAQRILLSLSELGISSTRVISFANILQEATLTAISGQHRDILAEQRVAESFTIEECIEIAAGKAGSLMSLACSMGAMSASTDNEVIILFSELGKLLGIAHQLDNDSHDLYDILQDQQVSGSTIGVVKTDLIRQKKTLPIVLAAHSISVVQNSSFATDEEKQKVLLNALHEGIITTWGISLLYREHAHDQLRKIEAQYPISDALRLLLGFT